MYKFIFSLFLVGLTAVFCAVEAQNLPGAPAGAGTPAGGGDKNMSEELRKMRSVELERIKREMERDGSASKVTVSPKVDTKFAEIKEDFEIMQISQAAIIKTYTTDKKIDYSLIQNSAETINKSAKRLDTNVFTEIINPKSKEKSKTDAAETIKTEEKVKTLRDLIVDLDNAIGDFVSSKLFGNLKVVDPEVALKTRTDLLNIQVLSEKLALEAGKLK